MSISSSRTSVGTLNELTQTRHPGNLKVFTHTALGHYVLPDRYAFLAPQGCGATLNRLLSTPSELRGQFLKKIEPGCDLVKPS